MSFPAIAWAVRQKLPCTQKIVLVMLADRHNKDTGQCNPSHERLAEDCGLTRRSVMDQIGKLSGVGYIRIIHRSKAKLKLPNQYMLMLGFGVQEVVNDVYIEEPGISHEVVNDVPRVVNHVHQVVNDVPKGSEPVAHKPVIEPVIEPVKEKSASTPRTTKADFPIPDGVEAQAWADYMELRKAKRAPMTATAMKALTREAAKAGVDLNTAVEACGEYSWQGFNAQWYAERTNGKPAAMTASNRQPESFAERDARNKREEWERMTNRSWPAEDLPGARPAAPLVIDITANEPRRIS